MKRILITLLRNGYTTSRKSIDEICKGFEPLKCLFTDTGDFIHCNENKFWNVENNNNRARLIADLHRITRVNIRDAAYFTILNEFANGDRYGAEEIK